MVERMRGGRDDGHVSPQLLLLLHPPLRLIMQPFSLQIALVAKCLAYELMKKVTLLAGDWPLTLRRTDNWRPLYAPGSELYPFHPCGDIDKIAPTAFRHK